MQGNYRGLTVASACSGFLWLGVGNLNNGANDGLSHVNGNNGLSNANWNIASRQPDYWNKQLFRPCLPPPKTDLMAGGMPSLRALARGEKSPV